MKLQEIVQAIQREASSTGDLPSVFYVPAAEAQKRDLLDDQWLQMRPSKKALSYVNDAELIASGAYVMGVKLEVAGG